MEALIQDENAEFLEYEDRMNATTVGTITASTAYWVSVILIEVQDVLKLG